jgi:hypothetical protein
MGYAVHVVRTKDWVEASTNPITKEEVDLAIRFAFATRSLYSIRRAMTTGSTVL